MMLIDDCLRRNAVIYADQLACIAGDKKYTWREFYNKVDRLAQYFQDSGLDSGHRVAVIQDNGLDYVETNFAIWASAAVLVGISTKCTTDEIRFILQNASVSMVVVTDPYLETIRKAASELDPKVKIVSISEIKLKLEGIEPRVLTTREDNNRSDTELAVLGYTSGTTGLPKGAMLTHRNMLASAYSIALERSLTCDDQYLFATPMNHISAISFCVMTALVGASFVIPGKFEPVQFIELVRQHPITYVFLVPTMMHMILEQLKEQGESVLAARSLRLICYGAAPILPELLQQALPAFACGFSQAYGMTEASPIVSVLPPVDHVNAANNIHSERLKSAGRPTMHARIRILDENGTQRKVGEIGEIALSGPSMFQGYWENPEATDEALIDGWFMSKDLGYVDEYGYLYVVGRKSDMIISGGINIYPREVELVLSACPGVEEVSIVGLPDEKWGEAVRAYVIKSVQSDISEESLLHYAEERLAVYKRPKKIIFVDEFPRNATGKILKRALREQA